MNTTGAAESAKRVLSRVGRGRKFRRRLPADLGGCVFPASLEGGAKFLKRDPHNFDPVLTRFASDYVSSGARVWDVGANVGLFTFAAAGLAGPTGEVVSIEADTWLATNLVEAARWNSDAAPVHVIPVAAADSIGLSKFVIANANRAVNHLAETGGASNSLGAREIRWVPTLSLDSLLECFRAPDVLKIDVEGAEVSVLKGSSRLLESRPIIMFESWQSQQVALAEIFGSHGYRFIDAQSRQPTELPTFNTVALPN